MKNIIHIITSLTKIELVSRIILFNIFLERFIISIYTF